jgi:protein SCO1/2
VRNAGVVRSHRSWPLGWGIGLLGLAALWAGVRVVDYATAEREARVVSSPALPNLGALPPFVLTERSGRAVTLADLRGLVWVATFFFSRCPDTCPLQVGRLVALEREFRGAPGVRMVAITVDPAHDTPARLRAYAERLSLDRDRFLVLTGERRTIAALARQGFKLAVGEVEGGRADGGVLVAHSDRLALVDGKGELRGTYSSRDAEALERLRHDLARLLDARGAGSTPLHPASARSLRVSTGSP